MAKKRYRKSVSKRIQEGCGIGTGVDYRPPIRARDVPSRGLSCEGKGIKTGRVHVFLSLLELSYFYLLEWSQRVVDIREQYPLPLEETLEIAKLHGLRHPIIPGTKEPNIITTDFLISVSYGDWLVEEFRTVKPRQELQKPNVQEKLKIEQLFCQSIGRSWGVVTEDEIPLQIVENIKFVHKFFDPQSLYPLSEQEIHRASQFLTERVIESDFALKVIASDCDSYFFFNEGTSLSIAKHLVATRKWLIDMNFSIKTQFREQLLFIATPSFESSIS